MEAMTCRLLHLQIMKKLIQGCCYMQRMPANQECRNVCHFSMHLLDVTKSRFFAGRGKKAAWNTWNHFGELTTSFSSMPLLPKLEDITNFSGSIERFVVLLYDRTSTISTINEFRKDLLVRKVQPLESIPPTSDALMEHLKRALYQESYCWAQSLVANQELPVLVFGLEK